jgi:hypothetical protein
MKLWFTHKGIGILSAKSSSVVRKLSTLLIAMSILVNQIAIDGLLHTKRCFAGTQMIIKSSSNIPENFNTS